MFLFPQLLTTGNSFKIVNVLLHPPPVIWNAIIMKGSWTVSLGMLTWISETTFPLLPGGINTHVETFLSDSSDEGLDLVVRFRLTFAEGKTWWLNCYWFETPGILGSNWLVVLPSCLQMFQLLNKHRNHCVQHHVYIYCIHWSSVCSRY